MRAIRRSSRPPTRVLDEFAFLKDLADLLEEPSLGALEVGSYLILGEEAFDCELGCTLQASCAVDRGIGIDDDLIDGLIHRVRIYPLPLRLFSRDDPARQVDAPAGYGRLPIFGAGG